MTGQGAEYPAISGAAERGLHLPGSREEASSLRGAETAVSSGPLSQLCHITPRTRKEAPETIGLQQ